MLTHDDACLGDVCALAPHDSNLGYRLPVRCKLTLAFSALCPLATSPKLAAEAMLPCAAWPQILPGMVRFSCLENLLCQVEFLQSLGRQAFPPGNPLQKRPWRMMGWAENSKMDVIRSSPLPKPPEDVCQDVCEAREISRQAACTARSVVVLAHLLRPSAFPLRCHFALCRLPDLHQSRGAQLQKAGAKRAFAGPNQNPRRGFWSPHSSSPAPQGSDRAPYNSPKRQELRDTWQKTSAHLNLSLCSLEELFAEDLRLLHTSL